MRKCYVIGVQTRIAVSSTQRSKLLNIESFISPKLQIKKKKKKKKKNNNNNLRAIKKTVHIKQGDQDTLRKKIDFDKNGSSFNYSFT
jgi:hypothetical protein